MDFKGLLGEIGRHSWWNEEGPGVVQMFVYPLNCFITQSKVFHPKLLSITILLFKGEYFFERTPEDEKYVVYQYVFDRMKRDKGYLDPIIEDTGRKTEETNEQRC